MVFAVESFVCFHSKQISQIAYKPCQDYTGELLASLHGLTPQKVARRLKCPAVSTPSSSTPPAFVSAAFFAGDFRSRQSVRPAISMAGWSEAEKKTWDHDNGCFFSPCFFFIGNTKWDPFSGNQTLMQIYGRFFWGFSPDCALFGLLSC